MTSTFFESNSNLVTWCSRIAPSSRCCMPYALITFPRNHPFVEYLLSNNTALPSDPRVLNGGSVDWEQAKKDFRDETVMERGAGWDEHCKKVFRDDDDAEQQQAQQTTNNGNDESRGRVPSFSDIVDQVEGAIKKLEAKRLPMDGVCVVGAYSTADDAGWATSTNTPACADLADIFTTLTSSTKFGRDLRMQLAQNYKAGEASSPSSFLYFALRPWLDVNPASEFRVFVERGKIIGVCQRCMDQLFPHLFELAVPLASEPHGDEQGAGEESKEDEEEDDEVDIGKAHRFAAHIHRIVTEQVIQPIQDLLEQERQAEQQHAEWISAPTLIVDIVHEGPDRMQFPAYILGVRAVASLEPLLHSSVYEGAMSAHSDPALSPQVAVNKEEELFRVFGSLAGLRAWSKAVEDAGAPPALVRIATSSDDLFRDSRAAHRGGVPLEMMDIFLFRSVMEQQEQTTGAVAQVVQNIVAARSAVTGEGLN